MATTTEIYDITKLAFIETLNLIGITIAYFGNEKQCIAHSIDHTVFPGDTAGYVQEATVRVDMLDEDFAEWDGIDNLSLVQLDDHTSEFPHSTITLQIWNIRRRTGNPIVQLLLRKSK